TLARGLGVSGDLHCNRVRLRRSDGETWVNQLWWIGPVLLLLGYGSRWLAKRRRSAAPRGNPEAISEPRPSGAVPDRPLLFISAGPGADEDSLALQAMEVDGHSIGLF